MPAVFEAIRNEARAFEKQSAASHQGYQRKRRHHQVSLGKSVKHCPAAAPRVTKTQ